MELLLNLVWLLLAVPAFWVWRIAKDRTESNQQSHYCWVTLACILILLFPVVSASDDLQAMRPEMEEARSQDTLGNSHHGKVLASVRTLCDSFGSPATICSVRPQWAVCGLVSQPTRLLSPNHLVITRPGRAPPRSFLA